MDPFNKPCWVQMVDPGRFQAWILVDPGGGSFWILVDPSSGLSSGSCWIIVVDPIIS